MSQSLHLSSLYLDLNTEDWRLAQKWLTFSALFRRFSIHIISINNIWSDAPTTETIKLLSSPSSSKEVSVQSNLERCS